jgi:hypothetical protein
MAQLMRTGPRKGTRKGERMDSPEISSFLMVTAYHFLSCYLCIYFYFQTLSSWGKTPSVFELCRTFCIQAFKSHKRRYSKSSGSEFIILTASGNRWHGTLSRATIKGGQVTEDRSKHRAWGQNLYGVSLGKVGECFKTRYLTRSFWWALSYDSAP